VRERRVVWVIYTKARSLIEAPSKRVRETKVEQNSWVMWIAEERLTDNHQIFKSYGESVPDYESAFIPYYIYSCSSLGCSTTSALKSEFKFDIVLASSVIYN